MNHNTFAARNRLVKDGGMTPEQAEILLEVMQEQTENAAATKADIVELRGDIKTGLARLKTEMIVWQIGIAFALFAALKWVH